MPATETGPEANGLLNRLFELTLKAATSWGGLLTAYVAAAILIAKNLRDVNDVLIHIWPSVPQWLGIAMVGSLPLLALFLHTIPSLIERRRILNYSQLGGASQAGYFTLRPRENEVGFGRADN